MKFRYSKVKKELQKFMTQVNQAHNYIYKLKYFDSLTSLPNRVKLIDQFNQSVKSANSCEKGIFLVDIDRFHSINELYGREFGDKVLIELADRLEAFCEADLAVFREGEDEFYIYSENTSYFDLTKIGNKILEIVKEPFDIDGRTIFITASIGISHYPTTAEDIDTLFHQAEIAMFKVKDNGKNNYRVILKEDMKSVERKRRIEFDLNEAISKDEMFLVYQPKVSLSTGEITAVEALLRWEHPEFGMIPPDEFIPIAEESGIIKSIGDWVIYEAVRQTKEWHDQGLKISVAVNISVVQFEDRTLVQRMVDIFDYFDFDPSYFIIEITESVMKDLDTSEMMAKEFHNHGIKIAIDDFGTGYSSLSALNNSYIDMVKIDRVFIKDVPVETKNVALVKTMIQMGETLGFSIIAEGIETIEQSKFLQENNCQFGQGFYYSRPTSAQEIMEYADQHGV